MSGLDRLRKKLSLAYKKVAKQIGKPYNVYRPVHFSNILDESNLIGVKEASFTLDTGYSNQDKESFAQYIAYLDTLNLKDGDILNDGEETFVITWSRGIDQPMAIRADFLVEIQRPEWTTVGGFAKTNSVVARNVPASFSSAGSVSDLSMNFVDTSSQTPTWEIRIWTDADEIKTSDLIVRVEDNLKLQPISIKNNKHCQIITCKAIV